MNSLRNTFEPRAVLVVVSAGLLLALSSILGILSKDLRIAITAPEILLLVSPVFATVSLYSWRLGLTLFFVWIVFEDLIRKFSENNMLVYFAKDAFLLAVLFGFLVTQRATAGEKFRNPVRLPLLLCLGWAVIQSFNPGVDHPYVPVVGLRMSFFYIPLAYLGYAFVDSERRLVNFANLSLSLGALVAVLGIAQAVIGLDFLNPEYAPGLRLSQIRGLPGEPLMLPRPNATFADAGRYSLYLFALVFLGMGTLGYLQARRSPAFGRLRVWLSVCWVLIVAGLFVSGQRAAIAWVVLSLPFVVGAAVVARRGAGFLGRVWRIALVGALALALLAYVLPERFQAAQKFYAGSLSPTDPESEWFHRTYGWEGVLQGLETAPLMGHGTGTASLGRQYVFGVDPYRERGVGLYQVEGGFAAVTWEWGAVGLFLWLWWTLGLLRAMWKRLPTVQTEPHFLMNVSILAYAFFILLAWFYLGFAVYQNYLTQAFLWFWVGLFFRLSATWPTGALPEISQQ